MRTARFKKRAQIDSREGSAQKRATVFHEIYPTGVLIIPNRFKPFLHPVADKNRHSVTLVSLQLSNKSFAFY